MGHEPVSSGAGGWAGTRGFYLVPFTGGLQIKKPGNTEEKKWALKCGSGGPEMLPLPTLEGGILLPCPWGGS